MKKRNWISGLILLATLKSWAATPPSTTDVASALDQWHKAAARADEKTYFGAMTEDSVFIGTDPSERWTKKEFYAYAKPHFDKGKAWSMSATKRNIFLGPDGRVAWFDEDVLSQGLGALRGSGVLRKEGSEWKIVQYNLSLPIPNDKFDPVRKLIEAGAAKAPAKK